MNKKASILDPIIYPVIAIIVVVVMGLWIYFFGVMTNVLINVPTPEGAPNISMYAQQTLGVVNSQMNLYGVIAFIILFALGMSILVSNFLIQDHPAFFFLHVGATIIAVFVSVPISNAYEGLLSNDIIGTTLISMRAATFVMLHLPTWVTVFGLFGALFLLINMPRAFRTQGAGL